MTDPRISTALHHLPLDAPPPNWPRRPALVVVADPGHGVVVLADVAVLYAVGLLDPRPLHPGVVIDTSKLSPREAATAIAEACA